MTNRGRLMVLLLLLLVGGAIVNVAVAWGIATTVDVFVSSQVRGQRWQGRQNWDCSVWQRRHAVVVSSSRTSLPRPIELEGFGPDPNYLVPAWTALLEAKPQFGESDQIEVECREVAAQGWPLLAASSEIEHFAGPVKVVRGGIRTSLRPWERGDARLPKVLPLRPIWPGFAINTVFYAAVLWLLFAAPFVLRRRWRIRRGLCPKCAYDLRGTPEGTSCPECGAATTTISRRGAELAEM